MTRPAAVAVVLVSMISAACGPMPASDVEEGEREEARSAANATAGAGPLAHGRRVWFENTYGGERFFELLAEHPDPVRRIRIGFEAVLDTPRAERFDVWGVVNDPDCIANPAGGQDLCPDPGATGVVGIRRAEVGPQVLHGVACAACHAGFDPLNPPCDPAEPSWSNVHPTIGNPYLRTGAIFAANLAPDDPRRFLFLGWPDGTVDTTALFDDGIMNPGTITAFWEQKHRPVFDVGAGTPQLRSGQGGEDDLGGIVAAERVYTNLGVCFEDCVLARTDPSAPIDLPACRATCDDFPPARDLEDLAAFLASIRAPRYPRRVDDGWLYARGKHLFDAHCAACHPRIGPGGKVLSDDAVIPLAEIGTNDCRARTTNWDAGHIWEDFSSGVYKGRGFKGYRNMPLTGVWATPPFLHNQSVGFLAPPDASLEERVAVYRASIHELLRDDRPPLVRTLPVAVGPFPAGTPLGLVFNRDPATGALRCGVVENAGHVFGAGLSDADKDALGYWLLFQ